MQLPIQDLTPGDVVTLTSSQIVPCDMFLSSGSCLVNEALLTGESIPISKNEFNKTTSDDHTELESSLLFCGTEIFKVNSSSPSTKLPGYQSDSQYKEGTKTVEAIVVRVGFNTVKGQLLRDILYPKVELLQYEKESYKFFLGIFAFSLFLLIFFYIQNFFLIETEDSIPDTLLEGLDVILTSFPPGLSLCLILGVSSASRMLKKKQIVSLRPMLINAVGRIKTFGFDKTGTITNSFMSFHGVSTVDAVSQMVAFEDKSSDNGILKIAMACCHSVVLIDGKLSGEEMEVEILNQSGGVLKEGKEGTVFMSSDDPDKEDLQFDIRDVQPFNSKIQRMGVVVDCP